MNTENDTCHVYSVVHPSQTCGFRGKHRVPRNAQWLHQISIPTRSLTISELTLAEAQWLTLTLPVQEKTSQLWILFEVLLGFKLFPSLKRISDIYALFIVIQVIAFFRWMPGLFRTSWICYLWERSFTGFHDCNCVFPRTGNPAVGVATRTKTITRIPARVARFHVSICSLRPVICWFKSQMYMFAPEPDEFLLFQLTISIMALNMPEY